VSTGVWWKSRPLSVPPFAVLLCGSVAKIDPEERACSDLQALCVRSSKEPTPDAVRKIICQALGTTASSKTRSVRVSNGNHGAQGAEVFRTRSDRPDMAVEFEFRLDRRQAAAFLTARGYRTAPATLAKLACIGADRPSRVLAVSPYIARRTSSPGRRQKRRDLGGQQAIWEASRPAENSLPDSQA
jgi:hypothetical protein